MGEGAKEIQGREESAVAIMNNLFTPSTFSKKREHPEYHETVRTSDWLKGEIHNGRNIIHVQRPFPGLEFTHFPAEGASGKEGFFAKRMGVRSGIHDFLFWWIGPNTGFIEMKEEGKQPKKHQLEFDLRIAAMGFKFRAVCYTTEQVRDTLIEWGNEYRPCHIPPRKATFNDKMAAMAELYRND